MVTERGTSVAQVWDRRIMDIGNSISGALFIDDYRYRLALWRIWDRAKPALSFNGLNPSTAGQYHNDPTVVMLCSLAKNLGFGGIYVSNLHPFVSANPDLLYSEAARLVKFCFGCYTLAYGFIIFLSVDRLWALIGGFYEHFKGGLTKIQKPKIMDTHCCRDNVTVLQHDTIGSKLGFNQFIFYPKLGGEY